MRTYLHYGEKLWLLSFHNSIVDTSWSTVNTFSRQNNSHKGQSYYTL